MLANGRTTLAIPGPSVMPDAVLQAMHRAAPNIYTGELHEVTHSLIPDLKMVAGTAHNVAIYIGNGHAAWEAALANTCAPGDKVLVLATGRFAFGWSEMAKALGLDVQIEDFGNVAPIDLNRAEEVLRADTDHTIKAVLTVQTDTSTSIKSDIAGVRKAMDAAGHPGLLMADCIACLGCDPFEMDDWGVDVMIAASQKGLMTPPGVCFVWFNDRAAAVRDGMERVSMYWDWTRRANPQEYYQYFAGTAPTHHIYGLRVALDMIKTEGLAQVWARHEALATGLWEALDVWGQEGRIRPNVADRTSRSWAVTSIEMQDDDAKRLQDWCRDQAGVTLGIGLGRTPAEAYFRIGHMGHVNAHMMLGTIGTIDAGLKALGIAHGRGAVEAAAEVYARAR